MKKIGVVTLFDSDNYGTCLQAYALTKIIRDLGFAPEILNFRRRSQSPPVSKIRTVQKLGLAKTLDILLSRSAIRRRSERFSEFRREHLPISEQAYAMGDGSLTLADREYDAFVTGSDMVWSWESRQFLDYYFLEFTGKGKRISYAPSFGNTDFNEEMLHYYQDAVRGIDYASCREQRGYEFLKRTTGGGQLVLDPTALIDKETYNRVFDLGKSGGKYALAYMFSELSPAAERSVRSFLGKPIRHIPGKFREYLSEARKGEVSVGPIEFLRSFYNADFILTDTYHGLLFALIFEKPFLLFHRPAEEHWAMHEERMASVLENVGLSERYVHRGTALAPESLSLDYGTVRERLAREREKSLRFLKNALSAATSENAHER